MEHRDHPATARLSPDIPERPNARALAGSRRATLRRHARRIRRSVALFAAALFSAAFLMVYVQLASGHDPALVADAKRASVQVRAATSSTKADASTGTGASSTGTAASSTGTGTSPAKTDSSTRTGASGEEASGGASESAETGTSETASAVTTSQS